jgi:2-dehydro-3-deoxyphosphogluconate aldolase / (4S)-4-hydroxy-2-oxoglutarate aldolase
MIAISKADVRMKIEEFGIIPAIRPALRSSAADDARFAAETLNSCGIPIAEINMTVPGAIDVIHYLSNKYPEMIVGADVLDMETAAQCLDAGAKFLTSPGLFVELLEFSGSREVVVFPGALTPTEVIAAWNAGADFVKVFPCSQVGGADYIKALHGPLPQVPLIASGGVNQQTATNFVRFGAVALGIGAELVPQEALRWRKEDQIRELARRFLGMVRDGRAQRMGKS